MTLRCSLNQKLIWFFRSGFVRDTVVAVTIYLSKYTEDFASMNEAYIEMFPGDIKPSRTCIGVKNLPAGTDVEITWYVQSSPFQELQHLLI